MPISPSPGVPPPAASPPGPLEPGQSDRRTPRPLLAPEPTSHPTADAPFEQVRTLIGTDAERTDRTWEPPDGVSAVALPVGRTLPVPRLVRGDRRTRRRHRTPDGPNGPVTTHRMRTEPPGRACRRHRRHPAAPPGRRARHPCRRKGRSMCAHMRLFRNNSVHVSGPRRCRVPHIQDRRCANTISHP